MTVYPPIQSNPIMVQRLEYATPCTGCDVTLDPGVIVMTSADGCQFYCLLCVTVTANARERAAKELIRPQP